MVYVCVGVVQIDGIRSFSHSLFDAFADTLMPHLQLITWEAF